MKNLVLALALSLVSVFTNLPAEETNLPPDPFKDIDDIKPAADYAKKVDRERGSFSLASDKGQYVPGSHFAHWHWKMTPERWGNYFVSLKYISNRTKLGVQVKVGDLPAVKSYAPRTGRDKVSSMVLGTIYIPKKQDYDVMLLTGDQSNVPDFLVKGIEFIPAPEGTPLGQSINGTIDLHANSATTFSKNMRYEPDEKKNCLGFWTSEDDWAEWNFSISSPGEFEVSVVQGCGPGNGGSEVEILVDGEVLKFKVVETGGFQNWKEVPVGRVKLDLTGAHKVAIKPVTKAGKAVMDIQKIVFTPVKS